MVIDSSALLAVVFNEPSGPWVAGQMEAYAGELMMSSVNYAEVLILATDRQSRLAGELAKTIESSSLRIVPPTAHHAAIAAAARLRYPLNLGDCFAYALAKDEDAPLLTLDRDFRRTDVKVILPRSAR